jgi:autotransporter-associated beta strand protein
MTVSNLLVNALGVTVDPSAFLTVNGIIGGPVGVNNNGTVVGSGMISNLLDNSGIVEPGTAIAPTTLNVGGLTLEGNCQATYNLNSANTIGGGVNDLIAVNGNVTINGGTINVLPVGLLQDGVPYTIVTYTGGLTQNGSLSVSSVNGYTFTVSTSTAGQINIIPSGGPPIWNGGSTNDNNWSDSNNWGGVIISSGNELFFAGTNRLNNTNDTAVGTSYNTLEFVPGAGAYVLNGNGITLSGNGILNQSTNPVTINTPLDINNAAQTFNGAFGPLIIGGGASNSVNSSMVLSGTGILANIFSNGPAATNAISTVGTNTLWTILDNPTQTTNTAAWYLLLTNGTLVFGSPTSAPNFVSTSQQGEPQDNQLGYAIGQSATLIISNGTYTTSARMNTGPVGGATGVVDVVNGTLSIASQFQGANGGLTSGSWLNVSGGTFTTPGTIFVSSRGPGFLNISGTGTVSCAALDISRNAANGGTGVVNLNGGTLSCTSVATETANNGGSGSPTATLNFNGGTLVAKASSATFYQGALSGPACPVSTFIQAGGAIINDGGFSIGINEPLQSGAIHDGGLTKLGAGTVTLNKANTYNGPTTIGAGTLVLGATGAIPNTPAITIAGGAAFSVPAGYTLGASQTLSNSSSTAIIIGSVTATSGTLSLTYNSTTSLVVSNGTFILAAGTVLTINNTSGTPLPVGVYTIIAGSAAGSVAGVVPTSFTVTGAGTQASQPVALQISGGNLSLVVGTPALPAKLSNISVNGPTLTITGSGGASGGQYVLLGSTNLLLPLNQWTPILTNTFDSNGNLNLSTNIINSNYPQEFYLLQMP